MFRLSITLAKFNIKNNNEGSYLGILWYLLNPLLLFTILFLIFNDRLGETIPKYPLYLLAGLILYSFFQTATIESSWTIRENGRLIKSLKFQNESLILAKLLNNLFSHLFEILIFVIFLIIFRINLAGLLFYPLILLLFCVFIYGISLTLSSLIIYIPDLANIWGFLTKILWFATPIFYEIGGQTKLFLLNLINPIYYFITLTRDVVVYNQIPQPWVIIGTIEYSLVSLVIGIIFFRILKRKFAEKL